MTMLGSDEESPEVLLGNLSLFGCVLEPVGDKPGLLLMMSRGL